MGTYFTIGQVSGNGDLAYIGTFQSNFDRADAVTNRIEQFAMCLYPGVHYVAKLVNIESSNQPTTNMNLIRVASPMCNIFLSGNQLSQSLMISNDKVCNPCGSGNTLLQIVMMANVTDDDADDYTWYGKAGYKVISQDAPTDYLYAGQLLVSDEEADRYCVPDGAYTIELLDDDLWAYRHKHASIVITYGAAASEGVMPNDIAGAKITLLGTSKASFTVGKPVGVTADSIVRVVLVASAIIAVVIGVYVHLKSHTTAVGGSADEGIPLVARQDPEAH
jgi:hypothetical protein